MDLNERMLLFRLASRELFNNYFHARVDGENSRDAEERFKNVEEELFRALIIWPEKLPDITYQDPQPAIQVKLLPGITSAPWWQLGRQDPGVKLVAGYKPDRQSVCLPDAKLTFMCFFDWDELDIKDNRYVRVFIDSYPGHSHLNKTEALLETQFVCFEKSA
jgi:hypothetical protein